jgi:hypothetical protein
MDNFKCSCGRRAGKFTCSICEEAGAAAAAAAARSLYERYAELMALRERLNDTEQAHETAH